MGYDTQPESVWRKNVGENIVILILAFFGLIAILGITVCIWACHQAYYQNRTKEVEFAVAAGLVEQPLRFNDTTWVTSEQYQPKIIGY